MPQDDISALNAKMDFLIGKTKEQGEQLANLQRQFDQSRGALGLIKTCVWLAGIAAAVWAALHGVRP
jgi:hypothetical protein